jgi:hypothetical protein
MDLRVHREWSLRSQTGVKLSEIKLYIEEFALEKYNMRNALELQTKHIRTMLIETKRHTIEKKSKS